jgi:phosphate transport system permease protein
MGLFRLNKERIAENIFFLCTVFSAAAAVSVFVFMVILGFPLFAKGEFFTLISGSWSPRQGMFGVYPMIIGTLSIAGLGLLAAFPLSLGCACLIAVLSPKSFGGFLHHIVRLMTGIPTVIYGFVGIFLLIPFIRELFTSGSGFCILSASMMLAILISPTMILFFTDSLNAVPISYLNAADGLGASKIQKLVYVMLPCAWKGILSGVILSGGRAIGDTLIALMLAGNAIHIPQAISDSARTLTAHIALVIAADYESMEFKTIFTCGIILYAFTILLTTAISVLRSLPETENGRLNASKLK